MIPTRHIRTADCRHINWANPVSDDSLNDGLVSWFVAIANHTSGAIFWRDLCGRNDGTLTNFANVGSSWRTIGRDGGYGSLEFDGSDDYVICGSNTLATGALTVSVWSKSTASQTAALLNLVVGAGLLVYQGSTDGGDQSTFVGFRGEHEMHTGSGTVSDDVWHHILFTFDGNDADSVSEYTCHIDGVPSSLTRRSTAITGTTTDNRIGWDGSAFDGELADVRIWDRVLRSEEAIDYYERSMAYYPGLLNRPSRRPAFVPSTGTTITPAALSISAALQGSPPVSSRTIEVT